MPLENKVFETSEKDTVFDIVFKGAEAVAGDKLKELRFMTIASKTNDLVLNVFSKSFNKKRIGSLRLNLSKDNLNEKFSQESILDTLKSYGGQDWVHVYLHKNDFLETYGIGIASFPLLGSFNATGLLEKEEMSPEYITKFTALLDILKVPYQLKKGDLKIKKHQWIKTVTPELQAEAYKWGIKNGFSPMVYSTSGTFGTRAAVAPHSISIEKMSLGFEIFSKLKKKDVAQMQKFMEDTFNVQCNKKDWRVYCHYFKIGRN